MKAGYVAMIGKPNVGKSTLLNAFVGQKVSIVSNKPQTTRKRVLGVAQGEGYQIAFIDTPGIHEPHTRLGRAMVEAARQSLGDIDVVLFVADASKPPDEIDKQIATLVNPPEGARIPVIVCLNKMDLLRAERVVNQVETYTGLFGTEDYMLTTATNGHNLDKLRDMILAKLPEGEPMFPEDEFTDQPMRFIAAELIREKVLIATRQEVPHAVAVLVEEWEEHGGQVVIEASIIVEKPGQKAILIGKGGTFVRDIGTAARLELQQMLERPVHLQLFVKVREDWRMNPRMLKELEYTD
jgi:GTPase